MNTETELESLDKLYEALILEGQLVDSIMPGNYYRGRMHQFWWSWKDRGKDIVYKNSDGKKHRIYGPAYISNYYRVEEWYKEGELHRVGGPARTHKDSKWYYKEGLLHRLDGPAVDQLGHPKEYWINGQRWSPKNYKKEIERRRRKGLIK
jgi:hypothetical protein